MFGYLGILCYWDFLGIKLGKKNFNEILGFFNGRNVIMMYLLSKILKYIW